MGDSEHSMQRSLEVRTSKIGLCFQWILHIKVDISSRDSSEEKGKLVRQTVKLSMCMEYTGDGKNEEKWEEDMVLS